MGDPCGEPASTSALLSQVWRGLGDPCDELYQMLRPRSDNLPPHFLRASSYHLGVHPLHAPVRLLR